MQGYTGTVIVEASDPGTIVKGARPSDNERRKATLHRFDASERGQSQIEVAFARTGARTVTVYDAVTPSRRTTLPVRVGPAEPDRMKSLSEGAHAFSAISQIAGPSFNVSVSATSTHAGVPLTVTVQALDGNGAVDTAYRGTVKFTSSDPAFAPGPAYRSTFTAADAGQRTFPVTFNTAGANQTATVSDTVATGRTGTSPAASVAETYLAATFAAGTVQQAGRVNLTIQAKDADGNLIGGYRGTVLLASTWNSVEYGSWERNVFDRYAFTAADAGSHVFTPKFIYAGDQRVTVTDQARSARTVTTDPLVVTNAPLSHNSYRHSAPTGVKLSDGSTVWAHVGVLGRLYARRNVGTVADPAWKPLITVRGADGHDSPSLAPFGSTLALFYTYTDGTYLQVWLTTSTDNGASWSTPTKVTSEAGHVQRVQAVVDGSTLSLFWSRRDTNQKLFFQTTTNLTNWSAKQTVGQPIGVPVGGTTSNFGVAKLASGQWILGWLAPSAIGEPPYPALNNHNYPTVHVATSVDLASWSHATELNRAYSQSGVRSVAMAQDPETNLIYALFEQKNYVDQYIVARTSTDGTSWNPQTIIGYERSVPINGQQGYVGSQPTLVPGSMIAAAAVEVGGGWGSQPWGHNCAYSDDGRAVVPWSLTSAGEPVPMPFGEDPRAADCATNDCVQVGTPINALTGYLAVDAEDLAIPARGMALAVGRTYASFDGLAAHDGAFGLGWHWTYGVRARTLADGSVAIVEANGRRAMFWKSGAAWTPATYINATLAAVQGGGYTLTRHDRSVWTFDASGNLVSIADRAGNTQTLTYTAGKLSAITAPGGRALTVTSDTDGRITRIDGPGGLSATYTYDAGGHLTSATDTSGEVTYYTYDARHQLLTVVDGNGRTVESNTFGSLGRIKQQTDATGKTLAVSPGQQNYAGTYGPSPSVVTDARGNQTTYWNDAGYRLTQRRVYQGTGTLLRQEWFRYNANGDVTGYEVGTAFTDRAVWAAYDGRGNLRTKLVQPGWPAPDTAWNYTYENDPAKASYNRPLTATDPLNRVTSFAYDAAGNLVTVTDPLSQITRYAYDGYGQLLSATDARANTTTYAYAAAGDLTTITAPGGAVTTLTYDGAGRLTGVIDPNGQTTTTAYDTASRVASVTNALNQTTGFAYDAVGNLTSITDPLGRSTTFGYNERNQRTTVTDPLGGVTTYAYDAVGNLSSVTDPLGKVTTSTYDALNRVTATTNPLGQTTRLAYDTSGNVTAVTDPLNRVTRYAYDKASRTTGVTDPLGKVTTYGYDAASNVTRRTDPLGHATSFTYDPLNRVTAVTNALNQATRFAYDAVGNRTSVTDALNRTTSYGYDARNRLVTITDPLTNVTGYVYDPVGNLTGVTDANGHTRTYTYDALDRPLTTTDPLGHTTLSTYDATGNRTHVQDATGVTNRWAYDAANRLTGVDLTNDGTLDIAHTYDLAGRRTSMVDATGTTTYAYDHADRITSVTAPTTGTVGYGYDAAGQRTSLTYPSGHQVSYAYTARGELDTVTDWLSGVTDYTYDNAGRLTGIANPNGVTSTLTYDTADRLTGISHVQGTTTLESIGYTLDAVGKRTAMTDSAGTTSWGYDALDRLTSATYPNDDATTYGYDAVGNRTSQTVNGATTTSTYDAADRLLAAGNESYGYDTAGRQTSKTSGGITTTYGHDALGRLTSIGGPVSATYQYNGDGLRVGKTVNGATTGYAWDPTGRGTVLTAGGDEYLWGQGLIGLQTATGTPTYAHADGLGSVRLLTDSAGAVVGVQQYDAFGASRSQSGVQLPFTYTGEQVDAESGLVYLRARYLDPTTGRFLSRDPFPGLQTDPRTQHPYTYVGNNPLNAVDPSGRFGLPGIVAGAIVGAVAYGATVALTDAEFSTGGLVGAAAGGAVAGATFGLGGSLVVGGIVGGAASGATDYTVGAVIDSQTDFTATGAVRAAATGGVLGGVTAGLGGVVAGRGLEPIVGLSDDTAEALARRAECLGIPRNPLDVAVNPKAPPQLGLDRPIGSSPHQQAQLDADIKLARGQQATDIRVNQQQVNAAGQRVGINRPDLQYTDASGQRVYVEYDRPTSSRGPGHKTRLEANDPAGRVELKEVP